MTQIVGCNTISEIWLALDQIYASASMARLTELRAQLNLLRKKVCLPWNIFKRLIDSVIG